LFSTSILSLATAAFLLPTLAACDFTMPPTEPPPTSPADRTGDLPASCETLGSDLIESLFGGAEQALEDESPRSTAFTEVINTCDDACDPSDDMCGVTCLVCGELAIDLVYDQPIPGPIGPQGPEGPAGPASQQGPPGTPIQTFAACSASAQSCIEICAGQFVIAEIPGPCQATSDTGTCQTAGQPGAGVCCVCSP